MVITLIRKPGEHARWLAVGGVANRSNDFGEIADIQPPFQTWTGHEGPLTDFLKIAAVARAFHDTLTRHATYS